MTQTTREPMRPPARCGRPVNMTLDFDAHSLLKAMVGHHKGIGVFVSELIRKEAERRAERPRLLALLKEGSGD